MTQPSKTIVFFGNERLATGVTTDVPTLRMLIAEGYNVAAVICNNRDATSRKTRVLEIEEVAQSADIPVLKPDKLRGIADQLKSLNAEIGVLVAYGKIIPEDIISIFPRGIVNIHPSLLPAHRGSIPIESVILDGSKSTGVSLMSLVKEMDAGPVYAQSTVDIAPKSTKSELASELLDVGSEMLRALLPGIISGEVIAKPQDSSLATYDNLISKHDGYIDWTTKSATQIEREVRAYAGWPKSTAKIGQHSVIITECCVSETNLAPGAIKQEDRRLIIGCSSGSLEILKLLPEGKKEMPISAFLAGYGSTLNIKS